MDISFCNSWDLKGRGEIHLSHRTAVIKTEELIEELDKWIKSPDLELKNKIADLIEEINFYLEG